MWAPTEPPTEGSECHRPLLWGRDTTVLLPAWAAEASPPTGLREGPRARGPRRGESVRQTQHRAIRGRRFIFEFLWRCYKQRRRKRENTEKLPTATLHGNTIR